MFRVFLLFFLLGLFSTSCSVGPDYHRPPAPSSSAYKEGGSANKEEIGWKKANPNDAIAKGNWWEVFNDPQLNQFEIEATHANQNLKAAVARVTQARAIARITKSQFFPNITFDPSYARTRVSPNETIISPSGGDERGNVTYNDILLPVDLSYEVDIWGRVRRSYEAARSQAQASIAAYETILLTLKGDVAINYFNLRFFDSQREVLTKTIDLRQQDLNLIHARFKGGVASEIDLTQAETELATTQAQAYALDRSRAEIEHALAVLLGRPPAGFSFPKQPLDVQPPQIPVGLPSDLLERRPDIAQAERTMVSNNAKIGIATAAFFPVLTLTSYGGLESANIGTLFNWQSRIWSLGPNVSLPVFQGGYNTANLKLAQAQYEESVATYRQQVLVAFQDVEDSLSDLHHLADQYEALVRASQAAQRTADLSIIRYKGGLVSYLEVVDSERTALDSQLQAVQIQGQRLATSVQLIKALGGGWKDSEVVPAREVKVTAR